MVHLCCTQVASRFWQKIIIGESYLQTVEENKCNTAYKRHLTESINRKSYHCTNCINQLNKNELCSEVVENFKKLVTPRKMVV